MAGVNSTLDDLAAVIGFTPTLKLAAWYGNTNNLYIPATVEDGQVLVRLLGRPAAQRLAEAFPGEWMAVPRMTAYEEEERRCRIGRMLERSFSCREVSKYERVSERRVQQICRELEAAGLIKPIGPEKPPGKSRVEKGIGKMVVEKGVGKMARKKASEKAQGKNAGEKGLRKIPQKKGVVETPAVVVNSTPPMLVSTS